MRSPEHLVRQGKEQKAKSLQWGKVDPIDGILITTEHHLEGLGYVFEHGLTSHESEHDFNLRLKLFNQAITETFQWRTPIDIAPIRGFGVTKLDEHGESAEHTLVIANKQNVSPTFAVHMRDTLVIANRNLQEENIARRQKSVRATMLPFFPYFAPSSH